MYWLMAGGGLPRLLFCAALMADLRDLRSKHALQLRSDVAVMAKQASKQHVALEKQIVGLAQDGF